MNADDPGEIHIVLPAHNEAATIGAVLREFHSVVSAAGYSVSFIVCEDGSSDGTADVIRATAETVPLRLLTSPGRKGYSNAVIDGLQSATTSLVGFIDSDGQCDPSDFSRLVRALDDETDLVVGYRSARVDNFLRRAMSGLFGLAYRRSFGIYLRDPSCPYILVRRDALGRILLGDIGIFRQGFWWEFNARAAGAHIHVREVPIGHRARLAGRSVVYRPTTIFRIGTQHLLGLRRLKQDIAAQRVL